MADIALRPRSATELVDAAFQLYRRDPLQFMVGLGVIYIPWLIVVVVFRLGVELTDVTTDNLMAVELRLLGFALGTLLLYTIGVGVTTVMADDVYFGRPANVGRALARVASRFVPMIVAMIAEGVMLFIGFLLFLLPSVYVYARFVSIKQAVLLENAGALSALRRSSFLTVDHKGHVLSTMGLVGLLNIAVGVGVSVVAQMVGSHALGLVITTLVNVVIYPLVGITETLVYYDLRIRREGFDIEYLAAPSSPPAAEPVA